MSVTMIAQPGMAPLHIIIAQAGTPTRMGRPGDIGMGIRGGIIGISAGTGSKNIDQALTPKYRKARRVRALLFFPYTTR